MIALKLLLIPLLMLGVSLAARIWGHRASGWLTSMPLVAGPIVIVLLIEQGPDFVGRVSVAMLMALPAIAAHVVAFSRASQHFGWVASLLSGWAAFILAALPLSLFEGSLWLGLAMTWLALAIAYAMLPRTGAPRGPVVVPRAEILLRVTSAVALMVGISYAADNFGARVSGVLMAFPIGGSVLPAFTRALHGVDATTLLMRGFTLGMFAFPVFFVGLALALPAMHPALAFAIGLVASTATHALVAQASRRGWVR